MKKWFSLKSNLFYALGGIILFCFSTNVEGASKNCVGLGNSLFNEDGEIGIRKQIEQINPVLYFNAFVSHRDDIEHLLNYSIQSGYIDGIIKCGNLLGAICLMNGEYARSKYMHQAALQYAQLKKDTLDIVVSLNYMGHLAMRTNQPAKSMRCFMSALQIAEQRVKIKKVYWNTIYFSLAGIGLLNMSKTRYTEAYRYLCRSLWAAKNAKNISGMSNVYLYLGFLSQRRNDRDEAIRFYHKSFKLALKSKVKNQIAVRLSFLADFFANGGDYSKAILYYNRALNLYDCYIDRYYLAMTYWGLGKIYLKKQAFGQAEKMIQRLVSISQQIRSYLLLEKSYELFAELRDKEGRYQEAFFYLKQTENYQDSLTSMADLDILAEAQYKYETHQKEGQIERLQKNQILQKAELKKRENVMFGLFFSFVLVLIGISLWGYVQRLKVRHRQLVLEQQLLRSQMNPHFVFNILASIQNYMYKENGQKASFYLGQFASLTRAVLSNSRQELVLLKDEIKTVESYIILQQMRFEFDYKIIVDEKIDKEETFLPPMLIQPFIENSINHGIDKIKERGQIFLQFIQQGSNLKIEITDNGLGLKDSLLREEEKKTASLGLKVFEERIKNLKRIYKGKFAYQFLDLQEEGVHRRGTKIIFLLPERWERWI